MQQDISGMNNTPHLPNETPNEPIDALLNEGIEPLPGMQSEEQAGIEQRSPLEAAELPGTPSQGEDSVLMVETVILPEATEALLPEEVALGAVDLDIAPPWYRTRWFYIGAGVIATAVASAGALLLIQRLRKRKRRSFRAGQMGTALRQVSFPSLRAASTRAQGTLNRLTSQLASYSGKRAGQLPKQLPRLTGQAQQTSNRMKALPQQLMSNITPSRIRGQMENPLQIANRQFTTLGEKARTTTARTVGQVQQGFSSVGTGVSNGIARTGKSFQRAWKLGRAFAIGIGAGAVWASLFTPQSGEENRAHLAQTLQRIGKQERAGR